MLESVGSGYSVRPSLFPFISLSFVGEDSLLIAFVILLELFSVSHNAGRRLAPPPLPTPIPPSPSLSVMSGKQPSPPASPHVSNNNNSTSGVGPARTSRPLVRHQHTAPHGQSGGAGGRMIQRSPMRRPQSQHTHEYGSGYQGQGQGQQQRPVTSYEPLQQAHSLARATPQMGHAQIPHQHHIPQHQQHHPMHVQHHVQQQQLSDIPPPLTPPAHLGYLSPSSASDGGEDMQQHHAQLQAEDDSAVDIAGVDDLDMGMGGVGGMDMGMGVLEAQQAAHLEEIHALQAREREMHLQRRHVHVEYKHQPHLQRDNQVQVRVRVRVVVVQADR